MIPPALIVARYFAAEQQAVEALQAARDPIDRQRDQQDEEHGGEEGLLAEGKNRQRQAHRQKRERPPQGHQARQARDEARALETCAVLIEQEASAGKQAKDAQKALDAKVAAKYAQLSAAHIQTLVVQDKWLAALTGRIRQLGERYSAPLPALGDEVEVLAGRVNAHLKKMGFEL